MQINEEPMVVGGEGSYTSSRDRERAEIILAIKKGKAIKYYNNFIVIDGKTYNGWTKDHVNILKDYLRYFAK